MKKQAFLQYANGDRVLLNDEQAMTLSFSPEHFVLVNTPVLIVYRKHGDRSAPATAYKYGGRGNPKSPVAYRGN